MSWPADEVDVDEGLVRSLLVDQHPDLAKMSLVKSVAGWDNTLWRLGNDLLVRLPRRSEAAPLALNEQRWLPTLAPRLPLPIPVPVRVGRPSKDFPWTWSIVPWLDGRPGDVTTITRPDDSAEALGRFLRALHAPAPIDAPLNAYRGVALSERTDSFSDRIAALEGEVDVDGIRRVWDSARGACPWQGPPMWLHGDLHPANILVAHGKVSAVIDFGDVCAGDPATDLGAAWMLLPKWAMPRFAAAYGGLDSDLERRALGWAVLFALMLLEIGLDGRPSYEAIGRLTLARSVEHCGRTS